MISAVLFVSFFIFLIMGIPIGICLGLSSVCAILYSGTSLTIVATNMYSGISKFLLLAIPFFVLSGNIMVLDELHCLGVGHRNASAHYKIGRASCRERV